VPLHDKPRIIRFWKPKREAEEGESESEGEGGEEQGGKKGRHAFACYNCYVKMVGEEKAKQEFAQVIFS
jgi:hypothetical protein